MREFTDFFLAHMFYTVLKLVLNISGTFVLIVIVMDCTMFSSYVLISRLVTKNLTLISIHAKIDLCAI